ncbi:hypothetical protein V1264_016193 [Littorina saxatilis]|uniref:Major facilitator superfamily (MFS) profile domain-containing protein n=2 Tax=Littorina saxatilis TaxID=31220 RepID=A0AAN9GIW9_9CAEN
MPKVEETKGLFEADTQFSLRQVFQSRELRTRVLIVYSNMFVIAMVYYGLTLNVTNLGGDIFINFLIMAVLETIGFAVPTFLLDRVGRKPVYCVSILVAGLACVISLFPVMFGAPEWAVIALCMTGRLFVCTAYGVIYVYGAELFPTVIRASAMGTGVTVSRVGSLISPYLADVGILVGGKLENALPLVVMGSPAILVGLFSLWLPETKGTRLPETLEDLDRFRSKRRCGGCYGTGDEDIKEMTVEGEAEGLTATR